MSNTEAFAACEQRLVARVQHHDDTRVTLHFADGSSLLLEVDGDCCSQSFFVQPELFDALVGQRIVSIEEREGGEPKTLELFNGRSAEETLWYFLHIKTDKERHVFDWRNESNGYYSGFLNARFYPAKNQSN